jgi:hypothetical protein
MQPAPEKDPGFSPVLLPPRSRADVVRDRPAAGTPAEVAAANPGLAAAVPATVGHAERPGRLPLDPQQLLEAAHHTRPPAGAAAADATRAPHSAHQAGPGRIPAERRSDLSGEAAALVAAGAGAGVGTGGGSAGMALADGSGMEVPELAVQQGWTQ